MKTTRLYQRLEKITMKRFLPLALLTLANMAVSQETYSQWSSYKEITINTTSAGANVTGAVTNFPTLVRLTSANADVFTALANGADIRFTASDGVTRLPHQRERWNSGSQLAEFWVLVPSVAGNASTVIRMYWGNASAADSSSGGQVFTASNGFVGAWHLGDAAGIDPRPNAVSGAPSATPSNNASGASFGGGAGTYSIPDGVVAKADSLRGGGTTGTRNVPTSTCDYLNIGSAADNTTAPYTGNNSYTGYSNFSTGYTFSFWFKPTVTSIASYQYISEFANGTDGNNNLQIFRATGSTRQTYQANNGTTAGTSTTSNTANFSAGAWALYAVTVTSGNALTHYKNGVANGTGTSTAINNILRTNAWLGKSNYLTDGYIAGVFDETQVSNVARSADWMKLSYETQKTGATCVSLGTTQNPTPAAPSNLSYSANPAVYTVGTAIPNNTPTVTGSVASYGVSPALPAGLTLNTTSGVISGTPTAATAAANYTVTATNVGGSTTVAVSITVNAALAPPANLSYSANPAVYTVGVAIANNNPTVTGTVASYAVSPALPAGLTLNTTSGVITGTPTAATGAANYTVTATNGAGSTTEAVSITVNAALAPPSNLTYSANPAVYTVGAAITNNTPTVTGTVASYAVSPAVPAGLTLNTSSGVISGTPSAATAVANYTVTATNAAGSTTVAVNITVNAALAPPSNLTYSLNPAVYTAGTAITNNNPTVTGEVASFSVSPALPAGLTLNTTTGVISGTPTAAAAIVSYTVTATNAAGSTTRAVSITVNPAPTPPSNLTYAVSVAVYKKDSTIVPNTPSVTGTVVSYSVSPSLPPGLTLNTTSGVITGTPTAVSSATSYTITATNGAGSTTVSLVIVVNDASSAVFRNGNFSNAFVFTYSQKSQSVSFPLPEIGVEQIRFVLTDMRGRVVSTHIFKPGKGLYEFTWGGTTPQGGIAPAGIYFAKVSMLDAAQKSVGILQKKIVYVP